VKLSDTGTLAAEEAGSALRRVIEPVPDIRVISNDLLLSYGNSLFFESQAKYVNIHFNLGYNTFVQDKFTALNSQLRFSYLFH
jgi:DNA-binding LytR/AlgR family response regulator